MAAGRGHVSGGFSLESHPACLPWSSFTKGNIPSPPKVGTLPHISKAQKEFILLLLPCRQVRCLRPPGSPSPTFFLENYYPVAPRLALKGELRTLFAPALSGRGQCAVRTLGPAHLPQAPLFRQDAPLLSNLATHLSHEGWTG